VPHTQRLLVRLQLAPPGIRSGAIARRFGHHPVKMTNPRLLHSDERTSSAHGGPRHVRGAR
jgi:hypothetical protein